jgi:hypothetical protein
VERYAGEVRVECGAGAGGEEEPRRFTRGGVPVEIAAILDRWLDPRHRYFKVRGADGTVSMLRHDVASGEWELSFFSPP